MLAPLASLRSKVGSTDWLPKPCQMVSQRKDVPLRGKQSRPTCGRTPPSVGCSRNHLEEKKVKRAKWVKSLNEGAARLQIGAARPYCRAENGLRLYWAQ